MFYGDNYSTWKLDDPEPETFADPGQCVTAYLIIVGAPTVGMMTEHLAEHQARCPHCQAQIEQTYEIAPNQGHLFPELDTRKPMKVSTRIYADQEVA